MTGPGDAVTGGGGRLRAAHDDRERVVDVLKAAFVDGRLAKDELELRVGQALASRTYADLSALTADIPAQPGGARARAARRRPSYKTAVTANACATAALTGMMTVAFQIRDGNPFGLLVAVVIMALFLVVPTAWLVLLHAWLDERAGRRASRVAPGG